MQYHRLDWDTVTVAGIGVPLQFTHILQLIYQDPANVNVNDKH